MNNKKLMAIISVVLVLGLSVFAVADTSTSLKLGDTNGDGTITAEDALEVLQYSVGKIESFSAESSSVEDLESTPPRPGTQEIGHSESSITDFLSWIKSEEALVEENGRMAPGIKYLLENNDCIIPSTIYDEYMQSAAYCVDETDDSFEALVFRFSNWISGKGTINYWVNEKVSESNISTYEYYDEILEYNVPTYDLGIDDTYSVYFKKSVNFKGMTQDCVVREVSNSTGLVTCSLLFIYNGYPITILVQHSGGYDALVDSFAEFTFTTLA